MSVDYLLVDAYNIIFAWDELRGLVEKVSLEAARIKLLDILCNFQGLKQNEIIAVFDAHNVKGSIEKTQPYNNITTVYTSEFETADNYIEKTAGILVRAGKVRVATSDNLEQILIMGKGAIRLSASMLLREIREAENDMRKTFIADKPIKKNSLLSNLDEKTIAMLEKMRRGMDV